MARIQRCPRVIYMSGTPLVHRAEVEYDAFCRMMQSTADTADDRLRHRVSFYDPRQDPKRSHHYAETRNEVIECPMSWAQTFRYLQHRRQTFRLVVGDGDVRERVSSSCNAYGTLLRSISNCPFPDAPLLGPKMARVLDELSAAEKQGARQVVYSSRRDTGVDALLALWTARTAGAKRIFRITGSMTIQEREAQMQRFNRALRSSVLFITDAGAQGIDCKRVDVVHILEPAESLQEERQTINRAVRYKAHAARKEALVVVKRYVSVFPTSGAVAPPWKRVLFESGLFERHEMVGITRPVQYALKRLIRDEERYKTIDMRTLESRAERDREVQGLLERIKRCDPEYRPPPLSPDGVVELGRV